MKRTDQSELQPREASSHTGSITVLYFARLKEALGVATERLPLQANVATVDALRVHLRSRGGAWETELADGRALRVAVNQDMAGGTQRIEAGDEVAFFPPVTGG